VSGHLAAGAPEPAGAAGPVAADGWPPAPAADASSPRRPRLALVLLTLAQIAVAAALLEGLSGYQGWDAAHGEDSHGYLLVARHFAGQAIAPADVAALRYRLFNPLVPAIAGLIAGATGAGIVPVFLALGVAGWIAGALLVHRLLRADGPRVAWVGAALYTTSLPLVEWGLPVMLDSVAWALAAAAVLAGRRWRDGAASAAGLGLLAGAALLVKPTLLVVTVYLALLALRDRRLGRAVAIAAVASGTALAVYLAQGLTAADFLTAGSPRHRGFVYLATAALFCYHWGWIPAIGWWRRGPARSDELLWGAAFLPLYLLFVHSPRLFFLGFPAVLPAIARGVVELERGGPPRLPRLAARALVPAYVVTSNLLAAFHLYVMRVLAVRSLDGLLQQLGR
jgi:hypothetical protein